MLAVGVKHRWKFQLEKSFTLYKSSIWTRIKGTACMNWPPVGFIFPTSSCWRCTDHQMPDMEDCCSCPVSDPKSTTGRRNSPTSDVEQHKKWTCCYTALLLLSVTCCTEAFQQTGFWHIVHGTCNIKVATNIMNLQWKLFHQSQDQVTTTILNMKI